MGMFELKPFDMGTNKIAVAVSKSKGFSIVGGGDSVAAVVRSGLDKKIDHISTGGGASLVLFQGKKLDAVEGLKKSFKKFC